MIGIDNVNEFYTNHYLAAILGGEVRQHLDRWQADGEATNGEATGTQDAESPPWRQLSRLQQEYFRHLEDLERRRKPEDRVAAHRRMTARLLRALGYGLKPVNRPSGAGPLPLLAEFERGTGEPFLWLLPAPSLRADQAPEGGVLAGKLLRGQHEDVGEGSDGAEVRKVRRRTFEELVSDAFQQTEPPRFVLLLGDREWMLMDRGKWPEQRLLRFDWPEILGRRDDETLKAVTVLLHRDALAPDSGTSLVDTFDDSSHKHAYEVSEDLKYALQASIEAIGNEAIRYRRLTSKKKVYGDEIDGHGLAIECIRYMYRVLFLLYIEARPELGYAPMGSEAYRLGYSFERLRDLEMLELETEEAEEGHTLDHWLKRLFGMVYQGTPEPVRQQALQLDADAPDAVSHSHGFRLEPLKSHLFDPQRTKFLNGIKLRNKVLLQVIRDMSLSRPQGKGKHKRRGRISYATLGINQLGAVYEALLSFRGFFAEETLYEVKPAKIDRPDPIKDPAFFVPERDLEQYDQKERVFDGPRLRSYPPGTFIYRMAGRDRQKSASYYTPEVLTRCLVKYALKELLEDEDGQPKHTKAEDLLELTLCEPAMGSAAFLNEAINQLAERYLTRRQQEKKERIPHDRYAQELQKVRMYIADNNVFGVDLNPVAVELAEVSLWLNAIFTRDTGRGREVFVPWFGGQLCNGNSLVGAWRKVFTEVEVDAGREGKESPWLDVVPARIPLGQERPADSIFHFLLPDRGMAVYGQGSEGKPIRDMCKAELKAIGAWRKGVCQPLSDDDRRALVRLSDAADRLWRKHTELLAQIRHRTTDPQSVYGHEHALAGKAPTSTREKDEIWQKEMASEQVRASSPYRRLKLAMDYWCALWFWPIEQADLLPDRDEWLTDMALLLDSDVLPALGGGSGQRELFPATMPSEEAKELVDEVGFADVENLIRRWPRLSLADELAGRYCFHHWELEFADLFAERGGFDLILGNPPWVRVEWKEAEALGDVDPQFVLKKLSATEAANRRLETLERLNFLRPYLGAHENAAGIQSILSSNQCYPDLQGVKVNLYKAFLPQSWEISSVDGVTGLLHPEKVYDEPSGGPLRRASYQRLRQHYQFANELRRELFPDVDNHTRFSINVYSRPSAEPEFVTISNLFLPKVIDECFDHDGYGRPEGIKNEDNSWNTAGHRKRIINVTVSELEDFASLFDEPNTSPREARLPAIHSQDMARALSSISKGVRRLGDISTSEYFATFHFNETYAQKDGTIKKETRFAERSEELVLSGPHFYVGNPLYKTPKRVCNSNKAYHVLDLEGVPIAYSPRTNFVRACSSAEYDIRSPKLPWSGEPANTEYRVICKRGLSSGTERTLQPAICPPGPAHIDGVYSYALKNERTLISTAGTWMSLPVDAFVKSTGASDFRPSLARRLPVVDVLSKELAVRVLLLNCITDDYAQLWGKCWDEAFRDDCWSNTGPTFREGQFGSLRQEWEGSTPIRDDFSRRLALVEIDVLVSRVLGWNLEQLIATYRSLFYVMRNYEKDTWYDRYGRIVFTNNGLGLPGVGLLRSKKKHDPQPCWNDIKHMTEEAGYTGDGTVTQVVMDDTLPGGPREKTIVYQAPWIRCDREKDYEVAWKHFEQRFAEQGRDVTGQSLKGDA